MIRVYTVAFKDGKQATALDMHEEPERQFVQSVKNKFGVERIKSVKRKK